MTTAFQRFAPRPHEGLYDPANEHDACGVAFVATLRGTAGHDIVEHALTALRNLDHRGAVGSEPDTGDGAGILTQVPDQFLREVAAGLGITLPAAGSYAVGTAFLPADADEERLAVAAVHLVAEQEGLRVLGWRDVPVGADLVGPTARSVMPVFRQVFLAAQPGGPADGLSGLELDRFAFCARKRLENDHGVYFPSLSSRTLVYKGMLTTGQLEPFFPDLSDRRFTTELALVHSRFSTNTFPSWPLAHPFRLIAHNGEINTVRGNRNWMRARESTLSSDVIPGDLERLFPVNSVGASDSASFDEVLELLHLGGRSLPHAVLMMIPEAWENHAEMDPARRAFYDYHSDIMEPWDGPASVTFTDGAVIGAVLDRNGLRPARWWVTSDGLVVMASETGVLEIAPDRVVRKGRLQPGRMLLVDTAQGRIIDDAEVKAQLAAEQPYARWLEENRITLDQLPERVHVVHPPPRSPAASRPSATPRRSCASCSPPWPPARRSRSGPWAPTPRRRCCRSAPGCCSTTSPSCSPRSRTRPWTPSAKSSSPACAAPSVPSATSSTPRRALPHGRAALSRHRQRRARQDRPHRGRGGGAATAVVRGLYDVHGGGAALEHRLDEICVEVDRAIAGGAQFVVLSDRDSTADLAPIPSLLLTGAVHHHLIRTRSRTRVGLLVEAGDVREVHHCALLVGYGAAAINPYLAMESVEDLVRRGTIDVEPSVAVRNLIKALGKGVLKVMSKMGISTVASYRGAQVFEALGLGQELVDRYFTGTTSQLGGIGLDVVAEEVARRHAVGYPPEGAPVTRMLAQGGEYQWRRDGEVHLFDPDTVFRLQHSTRAQRYDVFRDYTKAVDERSQRMGTLRGLFELRPAAGGPVDLDEVESIEQIMTRFATGAMSFGSISPEAHETVAVAMNRIGGRSNTGEGGESVDRLLDPERRSSVKQVASGRFGVTSMYLTHADDIQIKMAQGAKPGEGGQLPGHKVYPLIAEIRHSTPGVGLISPPPHHDIYSIEDLAQLIHDLKNANPRARIHVKLVSEIGVGTVAAGVSKAHADVVLVSGHDGGTGASPLTSLKHAGAPWELGLAETQQTLMLNRPAGPDHGPGRRGHEDRARRRRGCAARGRGVRLLHRPAHRLRLHHDAGLPPQHLPGRRRDHGPAAAGEVLRRAGVRGDVLPLRGDRGPRAPGLAGPALARGGGRPRRPARHPTGGRALEGGRPGPDAGAPRPGRHPRGPAPPPHGGAGPRPGEGPRPDPGPDVRRRARAGRAGPHRRPGPQHQPHRRDDARPRGHPPLRRAGPAGRHHRHHPHRLRGAVPRRLPAPRHHAAAVGGRQRLRRQGPVRRAHRGPAPPRHPLQHPAQHHRRERHRLRGHQRGDPHPGRGGGAVLRAQLRGHGRGGGRGRPRLRVHDGRDGGGPGADRPQLRRRDVRRCRLRPGPA
jgi:glutamate synthase (NADPH/NADH) large chain